MDSLAPSARMASGVMAQQAAYPVRNATQTPPLPTPAWQAALMTPPAALAMKVR